jgi:hypothetical protein
MSVVKKLHENLILRQRIQKLKEEILEKEMKITANNKEIFKICNHDWRYDDDVYGNDCKFICGKCGLFRNKWMYS